MGRLVASSRRHPTELADPDVEGVVFVQLDGAVPCAADGDHRGHGADPDPVGPLGSHEQEWTPKLPATTPASQMGILHGVIDGIPAFRWYDRAGDRITVANRPADAAVIPEADLTTGRGLLVDDGVGISNLFTGDAPTAVLTMSRRARGSSIAQQAVAQFVVSPAGPRPGLSPGRSRSDARPVRTRAGHPP